MSRTLDQKRAEFAWEAVSQARRKLRDFKEYRNLVKGSPALVMGNGLMAALAFYQSRGKCYASRLMQDMLEWLIKRQGQSGVPQFAERMTAFQKMGTRDYMTATEETLAMLKWLRQFADAVATSEGEQG